MGLFDRFKKKAEEAAEEDDFTVEEDSIEAEEALLQRRQLMEAIERAKNAPPSSTPGFEAFKEEVEDQWDDFVEELPEDPFSTPTDKKSRKQAERAAAVAKSESDKTSVEQTPQNPMTSTTGRELVASENCRIQDRFGRSRSHAWGQSNRCKQHSRRNPRGIRIGSVDGRHGS